MIADDRCGESSSSTRWLFIGHGGMPWYQVDESAPGGRRHGGRHLQRGDRLIAPRSRYGDGPIRLVKRRCPSSQQIEQAMSDCHVRLSRRENTSHRHDRKDGLPHRIASPHEQGNVLVAKARSEPKAGQGACRGFSSLAPCLLILSPSSSLRRTCT
jgi:hypothetical protein